MVLSVFIFLGFIVVLFCFCLLGGGGGGGGIGEDKTCTRCSNRWNGGFSVIWTLNKWSTFWFHTTFSDKTNFDTNISVTCLLFVLYMLIS